MDIQKAKIRPSLKIVDGRLWQMDYCPCWALQHRSHTPFKDQKEHSNETADDRISKMVGVKFYCFHRFTYNRERLVPDWTAKMYIDGWQDTTYFNPDLHARLNKYTKYKIKNKRFLSRPRSSIPTKAVQTANAVYDKQIKVKWQDIW